MQIGIEEAVTVRGDPDDGLLSSTATVAMNHNAELVNQLPLDRTIRSATLLAPNVSDNGPSSSESTSEGRVSMSGAMSFENLYLVNGAVVNENLYGQPLPLYVEDAIQEITTSSSAISAEYGLFNGGIVNVVTKSGGNESQRLVQDDVCERQLARGHAVRRAEGRSDRSHIRGDARRSDPA